MASGNSAGKLPCCAQARFGTLRRGEQPVADPQKLLELRRREAEAAQLSGEVTVTVKYRNGEKAGVTSCVIANYK